MKRLCCFVLSLPPLSAFAYPIEVDPQLNGTGVSYNTQDIGCDVGAILLTNLGGQVAECTAVFRNDPETPKVYKGVIQPGQNSNFTAQLGRDIIKLRIKLTCKIVKQSVLSPKDQVLPAYKSIWPIFSSGSFNPLID